ncbi:hypothetical protein EYF80_023220 [Liparis tanakae]|uniref:Uncharacterized protein n=1 Tax=Liparis tanakae TaxID=230148 RepID=A0A4Z2HNJ4_9TELE|nr:hypothetical protein EYF80_023220 [Liparis tanakae]
MCVFEFKQGEKGTDGRANQQLGSLFCSVILKADPKLIFLLRRVRKGKVPEEAQVRRSDEAAMCLYPEAPTPQAPAERRTQNSSSALRLLLHLSCSRRSTHSATVRSPCTLLSRVRTFTVSLVLSFSPTTETRGGEQSGQYGERVGEGATTSKERGRGH